MQVQTIKLKLLLILLSILTSAINPAIAESDKKMMESVQKARAMSRQHKYHLMDKKPVDESQKFRGIYYGYLPCKDCAGIKMTLSLKNKKNYLLVTQYAQASNREYYEKGKYDWDNKSGIVTLKARKSSDIRKFRIKDEGSLIQLTEEGTAMKGNQDDYTLLRSDKNKSREVHIH